MRKTPPIQRACDVVGSANRLAKLIAVSRQFMSQMVNDHRPVPRKQCIAIEKATSGQVTRYELRPDLFDRTERAA